MQTAIKYYLKDSFKSVIIFYIIVVVSTAFLSISVSPHGENTIGITGASTIFLFVIGLNSFKSNFFHFLSMCHTRKNLFMGFVVLALVLSCVTVAADTLIALIGNIILPDNTMISLALLERSNAISFSLVLRMLCINVMAMLLGYCITVAYYRMSKTLKWIVSVSIPTLLFVVWPYVDVMYLNGALTQGVINFLSNTIYSQSLAISLLSYAVACCALVGLAFLGVRRAAIKQ